jgi:hypothetical protein
MLDENGQLIMTITEYQNSGRTTEALQYQELLHRNLLYLAQQADARLIAELQVRLNDFSLSQLISLFAAERDACRQFSSRRDSSFNECRTIGRCAAE